MSARPDHAAGGGGLAGPLVFALSAFLLACGWLAWAAFGDRVAFEAVMSFCF